jgi:integrase
MPRRRSSFPALRHHRPSGQAVVTVRTAVGSRKDIYCGPWGSPEARAEYNRVIAELAAFGGSLPGPDPAAYVDLTVNELLVAFLRHAEAYYRRPDGTQSRELEDYKLSLRPLRELYGLTRAKDFGPLAFKSVRWAMVAAGLSRGVVNQRTGRVKRAFKWAASEQLIPFAVFQSLTTVAGLRRDRGEARETEPVRPVVEGHARAVLPFVLPPVAAMVEVQLLTGMRPGEVCRMRPGDIDTTRAVWLFKPTQHKGAWRGRARVVAIGPKAQAVLERFRPADPADYFFSPARALVELRERRRAERKSKIQPSQVCRARRKPKKKPGERYTPRSYAQAVAKGCLKAGVPHWHPNQLRHAHATEVRKRYGLEAAGASLGHSKMSATEVYAERDEALAVRVALERG